MPKPVKPRRPRVSVSDHAWERWQERATGRKPRKRKALAALLATILYNRLLAEGVETVRLGAELDLGGGIRAVLRLEADAWVCTTVRDVMEPRRWEVAE